MLACNKTWKRVSVCAFTFESCPEQSILTAHQSIKGLPRFGVPIMVNDKGLYVSGFRCVIRYRQSSPPCASIRRSVVVHEHRLAMLGKRG